MYSLQETVHWLYRISCLWSISIHVHGATRAVSKRWWQGKKTKTWWAMQLCQPQNLAWKPNGLLMKSHMNGTACVHILYGPRKNQIFRVLLSQNGNRHLLCMLSLHHRRARIASHSQCSYQHDITFLENTEFSKKEHFTFLPCFTISCTTKQVIEFVKSGLAYVEIILHISNKFQEMTLSIITWSDCSLDCKYTHENGSGSFTTMHFSFSLAADCLTHFEQNDASHFL